jgi:anti-sigma factor RsiW
MSNTDWHVEESLLSRYVDGTVPDAAAFSVEAHLTTCERCRRLVAATVDPSRTAVLWDEIVDTIDQPAAGPIERLLRRVGLPEHLARLLAATPSLRGAWFGAVALTLALAVAAAHLAPGDGAAFLLLAPLLPVAGVALAYGRAFDPVAEVAMAAPVSGMRLVVLRTIAVVGSTVALALVASALLPDPGWSAVLWLLPAVAMSLATIALGTRIDLLQAAAVVTTAWLGTTAASVWLAMGRGADLHHAAQDVFAFRPGGQLLFAGLLAVALATVAARHDTFDIRSELA